MKNKITKIYYTFIVFGLLIPLKFVSAVVSDGGAGATGATTISNPLNVGSIEELIAAILNIITAIGTPIAVLFMIYAGFKFVSAQGNLEKIKDAKETLMWTIVGIVVLLGASVLSTVISGTIQQLGVGL